MTQTCTVFYGQEIVRTTAGGELDLAATMDRLRRLSRPGSGEVCAVLLDLRGAPCTVTPAHVDALSREIGVVDRLFRGHVAILYADADEADPRHLSTSADGRYRTGHFRQMDHAIAWMTSEDTARPPAIEA